MAYRVLEPEHDIKAIVQNDKVTQSLEANDKRDTGEESREEPLIPNHENQRQRDRSHRKKKKSDQKKKRSNRKKTSSKLNIEPGSVNHNEGKSKKCDKILCFICIIGMVSCVIAGGIVGIIYFTEGIIIYLTSNILALKRHKIYWHKQTLEIQTYLICASGVPKHHRMSMDYIPIHPVMLQNLDIPYIHYHYNRPVTSIRMSYIYSIPSTQSGQYHHQILMMNTHHMAIYKEYVHQIQLQMFENVMDYGKFQGLIHKKMLRS